MERLLSGGDAECSVQRMVMASAGVKDKNSKGKETAIEVDEAAFLAKYKMGQELGRGSYSIVKRATNRKTKEKVAVKIVNRALISTDDERHLQQELEIAKRVHHPNIIRIYEHIETKDTVYIVMELAEGGELFERIVAKGHYSEATAKAIIRKIVGATDYLHDMKIAHRDLKPENLLEKSRSDDIHVLVADFGLACIIGEEDLIKHAAGSPGYIAPEVLTGESFGLEVDMWSLGVITYILLCGYPPFHDDANRTKVIYKLIKQGKYEYAPEQSWQGVSSVAKDFIDHLLVVDYRQRFTAKQALAHPWLSGHKADHHAHHLPHLATQLGSYIHLRKSDESNKPKLGGHLHFGDRKSVV